MAQITIKNPAGKDAGKVDLDEALFGVQPNVPLMHQVVTAQLARRRAGTQSTKTRSEVRGGGAKPYRQKGTGNARQGSTNTPHYTGGGVAHGPKPRSYAQRTPKKMIKQALRSALSDRASDGKVLVVDAWGFDSPKTKHAANALAALGVDGRTLVVLERSDAMAALSFRNIPEVQIIQPGEMNAYDVLCNDWIVFTQSALSIVEDVASAGAAKAKAGAKVFKTTADTAEPAERPAKAAKAPAKAKKSEAAEAPESRAVRGFAEVAETGATSASEKPDASASEQSDTVAETGATSASEKPDASASEQSNWAGSAHANEDGSHPAGYDIKGNADSMLYHLPDGRWYDATVAEVWFDTEDSAVAAGFTKAGTKKTTDSASASRVRSDDDAEPGVGSASDQPDASASEQSTEEDEA